MKRSRWRCCASESVASEDNETSIGTCLNPCSCRSDLLGRHKGRRPRHGAYSRSGETDTADHRR